jgi:peptidase S41-like protein
VRRLLRQGFCLAVLALGAVHAVAGQDLEKTYPGKLKWTEFGLFPTCARADVWRLKKFELEQGKDFHVVCKGASAAFGVHEGNVLWAVVFPDEPVEIHTTAVGNGEKTKAIFLRFPPAEVGTIFPAANVVKQGDPWLRARASRIAARKICWKWCTPAGNPTIVPSGVRLVDMDTTAGKRRFYCVDAGASRVTAVDDFVDAPVPTSPPMKPQDARAAFDEVWKAFDREYAGFGLLPKLDWEKAGNEWRKELDRVETVFDTAAVIAELVACLEDLHAWVRAGDEGLPGYSRPRPLNAPEAGLEKILGPQQIAGEELGWCRKGDYGYVALYGLTDPKLPEHFDRTLEALKGTKGLVVDLRWNGGGGEDLAAKVASRFVDKERVYSVNQYRSGSKHDELGPKLERSFAPRGPWRYENPVVVLWGRKTMSSAESMALMFAQCPQVTTMGDWSAGSSANPRQLALPCGITVNVPQWLDMDPAGHPIEHVGVKPQKLVAAKPEDFTAEHDPVLEAAFDHLRRR